MWKGMQYLPTILKSPGSTPPHTHTHKEVLSSKWDICISPTSLGSECMERVEGSEPEGGDICRKRVFVTPQHLVHMNAQRL